MMCKCPYCYQGLGEHTEGCPNLVNFEESELAISIYRLGRDRSTMGLPCPPDATPTYKLGYHFGELLLSKPKKLSEVAKTSV
jgi:hypothetical protein